MGLKKQSFALLFGLLFLNSSKAQEKEMGNTFSIGIQTRVTPIYQLQNPTSGEIVNTNLLTQADKHYSGPGLIFGWHRKLNENLEFSFNPCLRWDYLYDVITLNGQSPVPSTYYNSKHTFILDTYLDFKYLIQGNKTRKPLGLGLAMNGIGTNFIREQVVQIDNAPYIISIKEDFMFPAVYATAGLKFANRLFCEIKMGYCWKNPDYIIGNEFFFPEIRVSYDLFDF